MGLATVKGDQGAKGPPDLGVDEHPEGERQEALGDPLGEPLGEPGQGPGKMTPEAHLLLEVCEHRLVTRSASGVVSPDGDSATAGLSAPDESFAPPQPASTAAHLVPFTSITHLHRRSL